MSFYDDASLVFLPSGGAGKDTKAYSIKPTDGSGDFTFSRGSNLTATRVDSNGLIEKGRENLFTYSNDFSNVAWTKATGNIVTGGQSGYDGSNDAWEIQAPSNNYIFKRTNTQGGVQTLSIYVKKNTSYGIRLYAFGTDNANVYYNLDTGSVVARINGIDDSITDVGNDWWRITMTYNQTNTQLYFYVTNNSNVLVNGGSLVIQDAQLEIGLAATEYIESGASTGKAGILEDSPRFDYSGGASCPSLLLEPSRTNLATLSEYFEGWSHKPNTTATTNYETSPEGLTNATRLEFTGNGYLYNSNAPAQVNGTQYTLSCYAKRNDSGTQSFGFFTNGSGSVDSAMALTSEWKRFDYTYTATNVSQLGLAGSSGADVSVFGFQVEASSSYPTSYIPNHSGGSVTRDADITSVTSVSDLIGQTEGTIYCEFEYNGAADSGVFNRIIGLGTGVTQNRILLAKNDTTAELVAFAVTGGTTQVFQAIATTSIIGRHKVAMSYKANEYKVYLDGELEFTDTSASVPATTDVYIGTAEDGTTNNELGGIVKESIIYKEVLSEDNCKALTTL